MRFIFKTRYAQDIELVQHGGQVFWYGLLMAVLVVAPMLVSPYVLTQLSQVCIYAIVALDSARKSSGIGSIVGAVIVLYFLFGTEKAKAFFAKS